MATITLEDLNQNLTQQNDILNKVQKSSAKMSKSIEGLVDIFKDQFGGDDLEAEREGMPDVKPQTRAAGGKGGDGGFDFLAFGKGLLAGLLAAIPAIIAGLVGAVIASFSEFGNDLARTIAAYTLGAQKLIAKTLRLPQIAKRIKDLATLLRKTFAGPNTLFGLIGRIISPITNLFGPNSATAKFLGKIGKAIPLLGTILRTIFLPIGLLVTAYDTIKGAVEGAKRDGPIGYLTGGLGGLLGSIIGAPLDLLLSVVDWAAKKLGFSEDLIPDNFNVQKIISDFFLNIPQMVSDGFDFLAKEFENFKFKDLISPKLKEAINFENFDFGIAKFDLPNPLEGITEKIKNLDLTSLNFPKIGDFFGIDMNLGDKLKGALLQLFGGVGTGPLASLGTDDEDPFVESSQPSTATTLREGGDEMRRGRGAILNTGPPVSVIDASSRISNTQTAGIHIQTSGDDRHDPYNRPATFAGLGYAGIRG